MGRADCWRKLWKREISAFIAEHADMVDDAGRRRVVRHGYLPEREMQTGIGGIAIRRPRVRDRARKGSPLREEWA